MEIKNFFDSITDFAQDIKQQTGEALENLSNLDVVHFFENLPKDKCKSYEKMIDSVGGIADFLLFAKNCEQKYLETVSFEDCIKWIKMHCKRNKHSGAAISRLVLSDNEYKLVVKINFLGINSSVLSDKEDKFIMMYTNAIDEELKNQFGNTDTIVVK